MGRGGSVFILFIRKVRAFMVTSKETVVGSTNGHSAFPVKHRVNIVAFRDPSDDFYCQTDNYVVAAATIQIH